MSRPVAARRAGRLGISRRRHRVGSQRLAGDDEGPVVVPAGELGQGVVELRDDRREPAGEPAAPSGEEEATVAPLEQGLTQFDFQDADLLADGAVGHMQLGCRRDEAAVARHRLEGAQAPERR